MAHKHHRRFARRRNPFGLSSTVVKDAAFNAAGALGSLYVSGFAGQTGWADVGVTGVAAIVSSFAGKFFGGSAGDELLKGGLTATIIKALHQAGFAKNLGLGLYTRSYFAVPTSSDAYGRAAQPTYALPAGVTVPTGRLSGMGFHRFRSRYAGNY